ncbi:hypothetical protein [Breoghania sp.]|uniref:hypothetical protein n=1 Tax=Breoghania sp. TaxID=2065378 RepID=UPI002AA7B4B8|nr:hypothetical protein [Breoghania sp.]
MAIVKLKTFLIIIALSFPILAKAQDTDAANMSKPGNICSDTDTYALCTSARCIPAPQSFEQDKTSLRNAGAEANALATTAICACEVTSGPNFGIATSCEERQPRTQPDGLVHVVSLYSFNQAPTKPVMACPSGKPWTDCLDKPCVVDPADPLKAICSCDIKRTATFVTYGGACNTLTCDNAYWSAATPQSFVIGTTELLGASDLAKSPVSFCPSVKTMIEKKEGGPDIPTRFRNWVLGHQ